MEKSENETERRETVAGNAAAMREALLIVKRLFDGRIMFQPAIRKAHKAVDAALSEPPRQCDVGTAEEQSRRMAAEYCAVQKSCYESPSGRECPLYKKGIDCRLIWAQLPYTAEEGAGK